MKNKFDKYSILLWLFLGCLFYFFNTNVSLRNDDFLYSFMFMKNYVCDSPQPVDLNCPIQSLGEIFVSQYNHYFSMNGRSPIQFLVQLFCGILGKDVFNVCTSIVYVAFIIGVTGLVFSDRRSCFHYMGITCIIWFLLPVSVFYSSGISFAINYLWSLTACVWFLLLYRKIKKGWQIPKLCYFIILIFSFFAGWSHESFSIGISGGLFLYYFFNYKEFKGHERGLAIAFWLGTAMIVFSPGTLGRFNGTEMSMDFSEFIFSRISTFFLMKRLGLFILCFFILVIFRQINLKAFYRDNKFCIFILGIDVLFILVIGFVNERSLIGIDFFSLLLLVYMLAGLRLAKYSYLKYILIPLFCVFTYIAVNVINALSVVDKEFSVIIKNYLADENGIAYQEDSDLTSYYNKYVNRLYPGSWEVKAISYYYGKNMTLFPSFYKQYLSHIDSYLLPEYKVNEGAGLYQIPATGIYIDEVDSCKKDTEYIYEFKYFPVPIEHKYSFKQMFQREIYGNLYNEYKVKISPITVDDKTIIFIDNSAYRNRKLQKVVLVK